MMIKGLLAIALFCLMAGGAFSTGGSMELRPRNGASPQQQAGSIVGKIELRAAPQVIRHERGGRYQAMGSMPGMNEREVKQSEQQNVIVYLEGENLEPADAGNPPHGVIDQKQAAFLPHVLAVQKGAVVDFVNHDRTYHNVFSLSPAKKFNIGRRPTGEKVPVQFDKSGVVQVFCDIHSQMTAFVVVLDNPFFVQPDEDGSFKIDHVPPGTYSLKVWHERLAAPDQKVTVTAGGATKANVVLE
jgi:plastocyanin